MRRGLAFIVVGTLALGGAGAAQAAITVNTTKDELIAGDGTCSLREAVNAVDGFTEPDCPGVVHLGTTAITLPAGTFHLSLGSELFIDQSASIQGASTSDPSQSTINADHHDRVMEIDGGTTVSITGVTITGGRTRDGEPGTPGKQTIAGGNGSGGGPGGGIWNTGTLALTHVLIAGNTTGFGGNGGAGGDCVDSGCSGSPPGAGGAGGPGGAGGGLENNGVATLTAVMITGNSTGDGGAGGIGGFAHVAPTVGGAGGSGGGGAGIDNVGTLSVTDSTVAGNVTGSGGTGGEGGDFFDTGGIGATGGVGGTGGGGAGINSTLGSITVRGSTAAGNSTGFGGMGGTGGESFAGNSGNGGPGGVGGNGGPGAGLASQSFSTTVQSNENVTIAGNTTGDGGYGGDGGASFGIGHVGGDGGIGGNGGAGGGVDSGYGRLQVTAVTVSSNLTGGPGAGGGAGPGRSFGGGGSGSPGNPGSPGATGTGGGINFENPGSGSTLTESGTLVASNTAPNCAGPVTDAGHDLSFPDASCPHAVTGDPRLGPLGGYGGPTQTVPLRAGSAAIDAVPAAGAGCPGTDQRGVVRPQPAGAACDIGAYEYAPPVCRALSAAARAGDTALIQLSCGDPAHVPVQYGIVRGPAHGKLSAFNTSTGKVTYTPSPGFTGADRFTYNATDVNGSAAGQQVTISVSQPPLVISGAHLSKHRFKVGPGTKFVFVLSLKARLQIRITHIVHGHKRTAGTLTYRSLRAGRHALKFSGRLGGGALSPGAYKATLVASAGGRKSRPVTLTFVIVR